MAAPVFPYGRASTVLAEAAIFGDDAARKRHGVSKRTLTRYRARLDEDPKLAELVRVKTEAARRLWAKDLAPAISNAIGFINRACAEADPKDPEALRSVNGSLKILADVAQAERFLDARFGLPTPADGAASESDREGTDESTDPEEDPVH